jgi:hypothetical protein
MSMPTGSEAFIASVVMASTGYCGSGSIARVRPVGGLLLHQPSVRVPDNFQQGASFDE